MSADAVLLRRYTEGDEDAFRQIVERHLRLVYTVALRQVGGDPLLAEEVAQSVFQDLARHAGEFQKDAMVVRWLFRATRFAASHAVREDSRRRAREGIYARELAVASASPGASPWELTCMHLDEAVNELHELDRDAILLRFFQGLDLEAVGAALQTSGRTAQKRVSRALEKLRLLLAQRGVALSVTALAAFMSEQAEAAPPAGLAAHIAGRLERAGPVTEGAKSFVVGPRPFPRAVSFATTVVALGGLLLLGLWRMHSGAGRNHWPFAGLVSRWTGDGHPLDSAGRNHAVIEGNVTYQPGLFGQAFHLDGSDGTRLKVKDSPSLNLTNELTLGLWFRPDEDSDLGTLIFKGGLGVPQEPEGKINYYLYLTPMRSREQWGICEIFNDWTVTGGYHLSEPALGTNYFISRGNEFEQLAFFPGSEKNLRRLLGQWHHLAGTYRQRPDNRVEMAIYFDGTCRGRRAVRGRLDNAMVENPMYIGGMITTWFKGSLDDIQIYNRVLTDRELQELATPPDTARVYSASRAR